MNNPFNKRYVVTGSWIDKQTGTPKATLTGINEGKSKQGNVFQFLRDGDTIQVEARHSIGEIVAYTMQAVTPQATTPTPPATSSK